MKIGNYIVDCALGAKSAIYNCLVCLQGVYIRMFSSPRFYAPPVVLFSLCSSFHFDTAQYFAPNVYLSGG